MSKQKFSRGLKRAIAIEYMQSGKSRLEIAEKYASLPPANVQKGNEMGKEKTVDAMEQTALIDALQKQIKKLEKDLKRSQDQNIALNTLIDIAEEQGIRIRKKSGAKQ